MAQASAIFDAAYATEASAWEQQDNIWDVDFASALEQKDEDSSNAQTPSPTKLDAGHSFPPADSPPVPAAAFVPAKAAPAFPKGRSVSDAPPPTDVSSEFQRRARRASEAAQRLVQEETAKAEEEEKQRQLERAERRKEIEEMNLKISQQRKSAEEELRRVRERLATAKEEVRRATEEEAKMKAKPGVTAEYIRQHAQRAKEKSKELQSLEDEESIRAMDLAKLEAKEQIELESVKLKHVDPPAPKQAPERVPSNAAFQERAKRASEAALKTIQEREQQKTVAQKERRKQREQRRADDLKRRKAAEQKIFLMELDASKIRANMKKALDEHQKALDAEAELGRGGTPRNAQAIKQAAQLVKDKAKVTKQLEEDEVKAKAEIERAIKEEKKRQEEEDLRWVQECQEDNVELGSVFTPWVSLLGRKRGEDPRIDAQMDAIALGAAAEQEEEEIVTETESAKPKPKLKNVRFLMDPSWGEGSISRPGRSLVRMRKFRHLIWAPENSEESRVCVLAIFTDICALCKPEGHGVLRMLFPPTARSLAWAELSSFDPAVIVMHFTMLPPVYLRCSSPVESHYWMYLFPRPIPGAQP